MKKIAGILLLCVLLVACGAEKPGETTLPPTVPDTPPATTAPMVPATEPEETAPETTEPAETTTPVEPTEPAKPTEPAASESYTISISDPETYIYSSPELAANVTALVEEAGIYTIVEEAVDSDGNLWGRLKSGIGWVCLTEPAIVPVYADYAPEHFVYADSWHCGETDYVTDIGIIPMESITDVEFVLLNVIESYAVEEVLYQTDALEAEEALKVSVVYWGDMTTYGLNFTDMHGNRRCYALSISGKDGSLVCREYRPE